MSNPITDLITSGLTGPGGIVSLASGIIGKFVASPEEKLKATTQLAQMANDLQVRMIDAERDLAVQQASVIVAEAKSDSWMARNWRPVAMLSFVFIIDYNYVIAQLFHLVVLPIPPDMWTLLRYGLTGYIVARSGEKVADIIANRNAKPAVKEDES